MKPDFNSKAKEILCKRAGSMCSNPDCRKLTTAASESGTAIVIGEAAHICGARKGSARFVENMSDLIRAETTNGIWLCAACHKMIDDDPIRFPAELLFKWCEMHDAFTAAMLQSGGSIARLEYQKDLAEEYKDLSPSSRRILIDKPVFWEGLLTLEIMREFLLPLDRRRIDLFTKAFVGKSIVIREGEEILFLRRKMHELMQIIESITTVYTRQLIPSWGETGEAGNSKEILHVCRSMERAARLMIEWEEEVASVFLENDEFQRIIDVLSGAAVHNFSELTKVVDIVAELADSVLSSEDDSIIESNHTMVFDLPENFDKDIETALESISI